MLFTAFSGQESSGSSQRAYASFPAFYIWFLLLLCCSEKLFIQPSVVWQGTPSLHPGIPEFAKGRA